MKPSGRGKDTRLRVGMLVVPPVVAALLGLSMGRISSPVGGEGALASLEERVALPGIDAGYWYQEALVDSEVWRRALARCLELGEGFPNCEAPLAVERLRETQELAKELSARIALQETELDYLEALAEKTPQVATEAAQLREQRAAIRDGGAK